MYNIHAFDLASQWYCTLRPSFHFVPRFLGTDVSEALHFSDPSIVMLETFLQQEIAERKIDRDREEETAIGKIAIITLTH